MLTVRYSHNGHTVTATAPTREACDRQAAIKFNAAGIDLPAVGGWTASPGAGVYTWTRRPHHFPS